ncbi:hypothetical protein E2P81_ATG09454 [Venturia nashicola]|uniref:Uncharacterized protein n=1 Tax=Venturia nashicola TaxID=86259 RepID=A0A4Z1P008_9PEZI|nr:hypothetical protein E6O75_ATG09663 [Venturia nashicola]TLD25797.1 hypothetical protein E2P81_ATG09454 [Venturia nashicola]
MSIHSDGEKVLTLAGLHLSVAIYNLSAERWQEKARPRGEPPRIPQELTDRLPATYVPRNGQKLLSEVYDYLTMNYDDTLRVAPHMQEEIDADEARRRRSEAAGAGGGLRDVDVDEGDGDDLAVNAVEKKGCCGGCIII